jgi:hypothetical protein
MKIAFVSNKLTLRGTEIALYDYAHYNETILGNQSVIITRPYSVTKNEWDSNENVYKKFNSRFSMYYYTDTNNFKDVCILSNCDVVVIFKEGHNDGLIGPSSIKTIILCIFNTDEPHGNLYLRIGECINENNPVPVLHHICTRPYAIQDDLWNGVPRPKCVVGRYGGMETFNIDFVKKSVIEYANKGIVFLFMNTHKFGIHPNIIYIEGTDDLNMKQRFINSCDIMLHARIEGETYGLAVGEFILSNKMVMTYFNNADNQHIRNGGNNCVLYYDTSSLNRLFDTLLRIGPPVKTSYSGYHNDNPENVMEKFKTFL